MARCTCVPARAAAVAAVLVTSTLSAIPTAHAQQAPTPAPSDAPAPPTQCRRLLLLGYLFSAHPSPPVVDVRAQENERRLTELEQRLAEFEEVDRREHEQERGWWGWTRKLKLSGYLQPQLLWQWFDSSASPNLFGGQLPPGIGSNSVIAKGDSLYANGSGNNAPALTTNPDYFRLRRARLKVEFAPNEF